MSQPNPNACQFCSKVVTIKCATQDQADMCAFNTTMFKDDQKS